jgi:hypothetical protein
MKYFAIHNADLESERFLSASNDQIATWLFLLAFCSKQLNGGTIAEADNLPERFWTRHGMNLDVVKADSPLWEWDGLNVTIAFYDRDGEELYQKKVEAGKSYGRGRANRTADSSPDREEKREEEINQEETTKPKKRSSADDREVSTEGLIFADWFKSLLPETLNLNRNWRKSFAYTYDKMVRIDQRTPEQIRYVCEWARSNSFWQSKFMSPDYLRKRNGEIMNFDKLAAQASPTSSAKASPPQSPSNRPSNIEEL